MSKITLDSVETQEIEATWLHRNGLQGRVTVQMQTLPRDNAERLHVTVNGVLVAIVNEKGGVFALRGRGELGEET